ncbi:MAG: hypothetical protein R3E53_08635 [Myxococcota bacterium]
MEDEARRGADHRLLEGIEAHHGPDQESEQRAEGRLRVTLEQPAQGVAHADHAEHHPDPDRDDDVEGLDAGRIEVRPGRARPL